MKIFAFSSGPIPKKKKKMGKTKHAFCIYLNDIAVFLVKHANTKNKKILFRNYVLQGRCAF